MPQNKKNGFVFLPFIIIAAVVLIAGGAFYYKSKIQVSSSSPTPQAEEATPVATETPTPTPKPTLKPTLKPTAKATATPTATPAPQADSSPCSKFKPENGLATITVNLNVSNGSQQGDASVTLKSGGNCPGQIPGGGQMTNVIHQGSTSWTSPGLAPGTFRIDVNYHTSGQGVDVDAVSGSNNVTVTVSN